MQPKLIGYMCTAGAYTLYETGHPRMRTLPWGFQAMPVLHLNQIGLAEVAKAFRLGALGVLMVGCEACHAEERRSQLVQRHAEMVGEVGQWGGSPERLVLTWYTSSEPDKFFDTVVATMANIEHLPPLRLPSTIDTKIAHCG